jgi:hypothetical protein
MKTSVSKSTASMPNGSERAMAVSLRPRQTKQTMKKTGTDMIVLASTNAYLKSDAAHSHGETHSRG